MRDKIIWLKTFVHPTILSKCWKYPVFSQSLIRLTSKYDWRPLEEAPDYFIHISACFASSCPAPWTNPRPGHHVLPHVTACNGLSFVTLAEWHLVTWGQPSDVIIITICYAVKKFRSNWILLAELGSTPNSANVAILCIISTLCMKHFLQLIYPNLSSLETLELNIPDQHPSRSNE